jgi:hypothetical protein
MSTRPAITEVNVPNHEENRVPLWMLNIKRVIWPKERGISVGAWLATLIAVFLFSHYYVTLERVFNGAIPLDGAPILMWMSFASVLLGIWLAKVIIWPKHKSNRASAVAWLLTLVVCLGFGFHFAFHNQEFKAAKPHEFGSILQGWVAVLAVIWLGATVYQQQRSIKEIDLNGFEANVRILKSRLFFALLRLVRMSEDHDCYLSNGAKRTSLSEKIGSRPEFDELAQAGELDEALARIEKGFAVIKQKLQQDWVLHEEVETVKRLIKEMENMTKAAKEVRGMSSNAPFLKSKESIPDVSTLDGFLKTTADLRTSLENMLEEMDELDA